MGNGASVVKKEEVHQDKAIVSNTLQLVSESPLDVSIEVAPISTSSKFASSSSKDRSESEKNEGIKIDTSSKKNSLIQSSISSIEGQLRPKTPSNFESAISNANKIIEVENTEIDNRVPLTTKEEILQSEFSIDRIKTIVTKYTLGKTNRWHSILLEINQKIPPPNDFIEIDMPVLLSVVSELITEITSISSSELTFARKIIKELYKNHNITAIEKVSEQERQRLGIFDASFFYNEISPEVFATIFLRLSTFFHFKPGGILYDLGSGVGQLVYTASIIGKYDLCVGIEALPALINRSKLLSKKVQSLSSEYPNLRNLKYEFKSKDFCNENFYNDGNFYILNWTCFSNARKKKIESILSECNEGILVLTFSKPIESKDFITIYTNECDSSLGKVNFYINEKITPYSLNNNNDSHFNMYLYDETPFFYEEIEEFKESAPDDINTNNALKELNSASVEELWG